MKKINLLIGMLVLNLAVHAQKSVFPGRYNGSKMEIAQEIMILPDGRFLFSLSYGSVDRMIVGKWPETGGKLSLKEEKAAADPFLVFGRHNSKAEKGKLFTFKGYAENTSVALSFDDVFEANSFQLLHLRDQSTFSRSNSLNVTSRPVNKFFLSKGIYGPSEEDNNMVYTFVPSADWNDFILYYNPQAEVPPVNLQAVLKNDSLFLAEEGGVESYFAVKKELSKEINLTKFDSYFLNAGVPDSLSLPDTAGNRHIYKQLKSTENFKSKLQIPDHEAYFKREDEAGDSVIDQVEVTPVAPETGLAPPKATAPRKKTAKKPIKKKAR
jgi:hypothetical protein